MMKKFLVALALLISSVAGAQNKPAVFKMATVWYSMATALPKMVFISYTSGSTTCYTFLNVKL